MITGVVFRSSLSAKSRPSSSGIRSTLTKSGTLFPDLTPGGFHSQADLAKVPGVRIIEAADVAPGPTPDTYVFSRESVQRNLYHIPLP